MVHILFNVSLRTFQAIKKFLFYYHLFLTNKFVLKCHNSNGTHVIQKLIANITERSRNALSELILGNINMIINDMNGVCVVVKNILHCEDISMLKSIVCVISNNITMYSNKYSNYAVQALIRKLER